MQVVVVLYVVLCIVVAFLGKKKSMGFWGHLILAIVLSPVIGLIFVVIGRDKEPKTETKSGAARTA